MKLLIIATLSLYLSLLSPKFTSSYRLPFAREWKYRGAPLRLSDVSVPIDNSPETYQVYIGNLPFSVNPTDLKSVLSTKIGSETFTSLRLPKDKTTGKWRGFGYLDFPDKATAEAACTALAGLQVEGRDIRVDISVSNGKGDSRSSHGNNNNHRNVGAQRNSKSTSSSERSANPYPPENSIFIGSLDESVTTDDIQNMCNEVLGEGVANRVRLGVDRETGRHKGYGHIDFQSPDDANLALVKLQGKSLQSKEIQIGPAQRKIRSSRSESSGSRGWGTHSGGEGGAGAMKSYNSPKYSVFLGNLPWETTQQLVEEMVNDILGPGLFTTVRLATDRETGRTRGFGHIDFKDQDSADRAVMELNGLEVMGRQLRADHAQPKTPGGISNIARKGQSNGGAERGTDGHSGDGNESTAANANW